MDGYNFTEVEIKEQLQQLGYRNVSLEKLREFKKGKTVFCAFVFTSTGTLLSSSRRFCTWVFQQDILAYNFFTTSGRDLQYFF